jgi:phosphoglucosamine mutase
MSRQYFGTDGIRGRVGDNVINAEFMLKFGWAVGSVLPKNKHNIVLIGRDTRVSGSVLEAALQAGLASAGVTVRTLGIIPTPAVAYLTQSMRAEAGIVISASHNPYYDNGIKIFDTQGRKFSDKLELQIEALMSQPMTMATSEELSVVKRLTYDAQGRYIEFCKGTFPHQFSLDSMTLVIDAANGAGYQVAPTIFKELGANVIVTGCEPDGFNINRECGAMHTEALQHLVVEHKADLGIALDGDGDRLLLVDERGNLVDGDEILAILAHEQSTGLRCRAGVVGTLMSNLGLEQSLQNTSIDFVRSKVGDRYVLEALVENGWTLGGEASGHIIDLDYTTTGDGIVTALQVLRVMKMQKESLSQLKTVMTKRPQILENIRYEGDIDVINHPKVQTVVAQLTEKFDGRGRILLRLSGTEPLVRVMVEGNDASEVKTVVSALVAVVKHVAGIESASAEPAVAN